VLPTYHSMKMKESEPDTAIVKVKVGIGKVHGIATTEMTLQESEAPVRASYVGKGKVMGGAYNMIVAFDLEASADGGTRINWTGTTQIYGRILSIAGGGLRGYAEKEIRKVIDSLQSALVSKEHFEYINEFGTFNWVTPDSDCGGLTQSGICRLKYRLVSQGAGAGNNAYRSFLEN